MTEQQVRQIVEDALEEHQRKACRTSHVQEVPEWGRETSSKLVGLIRGDGSGLGLTYDLLRQPALHDRAGVYG